MTKVMKPYRFDPGTITRLYLRDFPDPDKAELWWQDLEEQGWDKDRIDAAKELAMLLPTPSDLVTWTAREVFEPDSIEKYGLKDEFDKLDISLFSKVGISEDMAKNYWMAHWAHTNFSQMIELLHRGLLTGAREPPEEPKTKEEWEARDKEGIDQLYEWYRLVEVTPFWRKLLTEATWNIPTRVDVRRWWEMGTINEAELRSIYHRQGYHGTDLDNYVTWTKVYSGFPDLIARCKNGWIPEEEVKAQLFDWVKDEVKAQEIWETKFKNAVAPERVAAERDLTKTEIIKGVKAGLISSGQGAELLGRLGYDPSEAEYIVAVNVAAAGSPESYLEFKQLTESYRRSQGLETKEIPQEVIDLEKELGTVERRLKEAKKAREPQATINELEVRRAELAVRYRELLMAAGLS